MKRNCLIMLAMAFVSLSIGHSNAADTSAITLDGRVDEKDWHQVPNASGWFKLNDPQGKLTSLPSTLYLHHDDQALYIAIVCDRAPVEVGHVFAQQRDDEAWRDESVELFIQPDRQSDRYFHYVINTLGVVMDQINQGPPKQWSHPGLEAAAGLNDERDQFTVEVRLPFEGWVAPPDDEATWGFNALRTVMANPAGMRGIASLSRLDSSAHDTARFSELIFGDDGLKLDRRGMMEPGDGGPIANPSFENELDDWQVHSWSGGRYGPGRFEVISSDDAMDGRSSVCLVGENTGIRGAIEPSRVGIISEPIDMPPGVFYLCGYYRTDFTDTELGQVRPALADIYLYGPDEVSHRLEASSRWKRFRLPIEKRTAGASPIMLRLSTDGRIWFDALEIVQVATGDENPLPGARLIEVNDRSFRILYPPVDQLTFTPTAQQQQVGLIPFVRRELWEFVHDRTAPRSQDVIAALDLAAAPAEFESALLGLYALQDIDPVEVRFESNVFEMGAYDAQPIPPSWVQLARIPYWLQRTGYTGTEARPIAEVIRPVEGLSVKKAMKAEHNAWFYLTVNTPDDAKPGIYEGNIVVRGREGTQMKLPVSLTVYPFQLVEQDQHFGVYVEWYQDFEQVFAFMRRYGLDSAVLFSLIELEQKQGRWIINPEPIETPTRKYIEAGMAPPFVIGMGPMSTHLSHRLGVRDQMGTDIIADAGGAIAPVTEDAYPDALRDAYRHAIGQLWNQLEDADLAEHVALYPIDEPTSNLHRMPMAKVEMSLIKDVAPDAPIFCTVHDHPERLQQLAPWLDIACVGGQDYSPALYQVIDENDIDLWAYNGPAEQWNAQRGDGFGAAAAGIERQIYWIGHRQLANADQPLNDLIDPFKQVAMFYPSEDGYLSTVQYEALREGIDDLRYLATAERFIERAEGGEFDVDAQTLEQARQQFNMIRQRINTDLNWDQCQAIRKQLVDVILMLIP